MEHDETPPYILLLRNRVNTQIKRVRKDVAALEALFRYHPDELEREVKMITKNLSLVAEDADKRLGNAQKAIEEFNEEFENAEEEDQEYTLEDARDIAHKKNQEAREVSESNSRSTPKSVKRAKKEGFQYESASAINPAPNTNTDGVPKKAAKYRLRARKNTLADGLEEFEHNVDVPTGSSKPPYRDKLIKRTKLRNSFDPTEGQKIMNTKGQKRAPIEAENYSKPMPVIIMRQYEVLHNKTEFEKVSQIRFNSQASLMAASALMARLFRDKDNCSKLLNDNSNLCVYDPATAKINKPYIPYNTKLVYFTSLLKKKEWNGLNETRILDGIPAGRLWAALEIWAAWVKEKKIVMRGGEEKRGDVLALGEFLKTEMGFMAAVKAFKF